MNGDEYQVVRRTATRARLDRKPRYVCGLCGHAVYAPRESRTGQPYWRHHLGAPEDCPWWTGKPSDVDDVSGQQFRGAQESPLHAAIKATVGDLLREDARTAPGSVVIDEYLILENGRRRPDVRAIYDNMPVVFEVQLATTQIPIIVQREDFYDEHAHRMLWLTWNFLPPPEGGRLLSSFEDISYSHGKNLFSMDDETIARSKQTGELLLRVFWKHGDAWSSKLVKLAELNWSPNGRAFAVAPEPPWKEDFLLRWRAGTGQFGTQRAEREPLLTELAEKLAVRDIGLEELEEAGADDLINCLLSLLDGHPVGSRQKNLVELLNTFLSVERRHRFARVVRRFAELCGRQQELSAISVQKKISAAMMSPQDDPSSLTGLIALKLFPETFQQRKSSLDYKLK